MYINVHVSYPLFVSHFDESRIFLIDFVKKNL